jgi:alkylated DNA repair dioxygenase AlkB
MNIQPSLFNIVKEELPIADGYLAYYPNWIDQSEGFLLFDALRQDIKWQQSMINIYGKKIPIPRLNAWYGDEQCSYKYSGTYFEPNSWLPALLMIKNRIESLSGFQFNSVLANCYRNGNDSVAWHSDDEPELGRNPAVASLSLGVERQFQLKHRYNKDLKPHKILLTHGSLLVMAGELQHHWRHQIPKNQRKLGERINLTFRYVIPQSERR